MKIKMIFSAIVVTIIVTTALAFKPVGSGSIYCSATCNSWTRIDYRLEPTGTITDPCENGSGGEYVLVCAGNNPVCTEVCGYFAPTAP